MMSRFGVGLCLMAFVAWTLVAQSVRVTPGLYNNLSWRFVGPFRGGRTRAACGVPSQPNVFYIGAVDGGVWKSDDYGRTWKPIFDHEKTQSVGAIAVAPSDPNIVYVASGEGLQRPDLSVGNGIYRSTDAGRTWTHLGLRQGEQIPALAIDPGNPDIVFAAVLGHPYGPNPQRGIFRSADGGRTWTKVLYVDENTGGDDVEIDPQNPRIVYATLWRARQGPWEDSNCYGGAGGGIYKSTDGGTTWARLSGGLPGHMVQAYVAIAPSEPTRLYATIATTMESAYQSGHGLRFYRSDDAGAHWYRETTDPRPVERIGGGDLPVARVDPKNPDVVYSTSIVTWRSTDGGKTWRAFRGAPGGDDYQNIWMNPNDPDIVLLVGDQGAVVTVNGGKTWSSWYNQPTAQIYHVITDDQFPYRIYGGQQESGSVGIESRGNDGEITFRDWHPVGVIEYGYVAPDPLHPNIVYGAGRNRVSKFNWITGQVQDVTPIPTNSSKYREDRTEPIVFSPVDPHVLYYAANVLFKTMNGGESWERMSPDLTRPHPGIPASLGALAAKSPYAHRVRGAIYAVAPSYRSVDTIWAGTDDGWVWVTRDGGKNWKNITPPGIIPWLKVTQISGSRFDDQTAYVSFSGFRIDNMRPYIYRTHDGGRTWKLVVNGLPDNEPVDTVRADPIRKGLLFAGTETAVWVSFNDGGRWLPLQLNLPHTSMRDLWIHDNDLIVATHGRGFWVLDDITPLRQIAAAQDSGKAGFHWVGESGSDSAPAWSTFLFKPETAWRIRRDANTDTPLPPDEPAGKNPPSGAILDYYLSSHAQGPVTLEILDAQGKVARRYTSDQKPPFTLAELAEKSQYPVCWYKVPRILPTSRGPHRWVWDLHYRAPESLHPDLPISAIIHDTPTVPAGPRALPGRYTVELTVNGKTYRQPLTVKMDPRVHATPTALEQQFKLETEIAAGMDRSFDALMRAKALDEDLKALESKTSSEPLRKEVARLEAKTSSLIAAPKAAEGMATGQKAPTTFTQLNNQLNDLYGIVDAADAAPNAEESAAYPPLADQLAQLISRWNAIETRDVPALNRQLKRAGVPAIH